MNRPIDYRLKWYKEKRKEIIEALGSVCAVCGTWWDIEIDHIQGYEGKLSPNKTRGGYRNLLDARRLIKEGRVNELRCLCKECNEKQRPNNGGGAKD